MTDEAAAPAPPASAAAEATADEALQTADTGSAAPSRRAAAKPAEGPSTLVVSSPVPVEARLLDSNQNGLQTVALGERLTLEPGTYFVSVNRTRARVVVTGEPKEITLTAATLRVLGPAGVPFRLLDSNANGLVEGTLNDPLAVLPGAYFVSVNRTRRPVTVADGASEVTVATSTLVVNGPSGGSFRLLDSNHNGLQEGRFGEPLAVVAGDYFVEVNRTRQAVGVPEGTGRVTVATSTLVVNGPSGGSFRLLDSNQNGLTEGTFGEPLTVLAGDYFVDVNRTRRPVSVPEGTGRVTVATSTLVVNGPSGGSFRLLDSNHNGLQEGRFGEPLAVLAGDYFVQIGDERRPVTVEEGRTVRVGGGAEPAVEEAA